jgi:alpha-tubulin suppressor-like RCC1 family protein
MFSQRFLLCESLPVSGTNLTNKRIAAFSFSDNHAVAVLSNGESLAIGLNSTAQLGIGTSDNATVLTRVNTNEQIVAAVACAGFSLFLTDRNVVLSSGLSGALSPVELPIQATKLSGYKNSVAIITPDRNIVFWPDFHNRGGSHSPALLADPKTVACGDQFVAVLLENNLLFRVESDGQSRVLSVRKTVLTGGSRFVAVSASSTYAIAIDEDGSAWIFGEFNRFPQKTLSSIPVFESVIDVFALPQYAVGVSRTFMAMGIGKRPETIRDETDSDYVAQVIVQGAATNYVAGNEKDLIVLPVHSTYEQSLQLADQFIRESLSCSLEFDESK